MFFAKNEENEKILQFCTSYDTKIECKDIEGNEVINEDAPLAKIPKENPKRVTIPTDGGLTYLDDSEDIGDPRAVWVKLKEKEPEYLAVIGSFIGIPRANLYLFTPDSELVYHELLAEDVETITVLPIENGLEEILIGGRETIWQFAVK